MIVKAVIGPKNVSYIILKRFLRFNLHDFFPNKWVLSSQDGIFPCADNEVGPRWRSRCSSPRCKHVSATPADHGGLGVGQVPAGGLGHHLGQLGDRQQRVRQGRALDELGSTSMVCTNGAVVETGKEGERVVHRGWDREALMRHIGQVGAETISKMHGLNEALRRMTHTRLDPERFHKLTNAAAAPLGQTGMEELRMDISPDSSVYDAYNHLDCLSQRKSPGPSIAKEHETEVKRRWLKADYCEQSLIHFLPLRLSPSHIGQTNESTGGDLDPIIIHRSVSEGHIQDEEEKQMLSHLGYTQYDRLVLPLILLLSFGPHRCSENRDISKGMSLWIWQGTFVLYFNSRWKTMVCHFTRRSWWSLSRTSLMTVIRAHIQFM